jgi:hypothetical protein
MEPNASDLLRVPAAATRNRDVQSIDRCREVDAVPGGRALETDRRVPANRNREGVRHCGTDGVHTPRDPSEQPSPHEIREVVVAQARRQTLLAGHQAPVPLRDFSENIQ